MTALPTGWAAATLRELCVSIEKAPPSERFRYIDISSIDNQHNRIIDARELEPGSAPSRARQHVRRGDVVLSTVRTYLRNTAQVPDELDVAVASTGFCVLRAGPAISPRFLFFRCLDAAFVSRLNTLQTGSSYPAVRDRDVLDQEIEVPPLPEQERIVAAIEEQFSRLDAGTGVLESARRRLGLWATAATVEAVAGDWPTKPIGDFARVGSGATPKRGRADYYENGTVPWVTSGQLVNEFVTEPTAYITEKAVRETSVKLWPKHTLLVAMYGEGRTRGHCSELLFKSTTNQACAAIVVPDDAPIRREFLKLVLTANYERNRRLASGGVQPNLSLGLVRAMEIPVPPIERQQRIVDEAQRHRSVIDALTTAIDHSLVRSRHLRRAILSEAFAGRLVPQDPSDDPASELLARIAAERPAPPRPRQRKRA